MSVEREVLAAAESLVAAFGRHDVAGYFASFAPGATFIFYSHCVPLDSRAEYERLWRRWERESGFRVLSCVSSQQRVQDLGTAAVFTHLVRTAVRTSDGEETLVERETIVFSRLDGQWKAVHEHLSPADAAD